MREFSTFIKEGLANGLKPFETFRDSGFLEDLYNLLPTNSGLRSYQAITDVLPIPQDERKLYYPFPQWFRLENDNFVITKDSLFEITEYSNPPYDLHYKSTDLDNLTESMRVVDYGDNWMLLSRDGCLYKRKGEVTFTKKLKASTINQYKNRTVIGGPMNGLWTEDFLTELDQMVNLTDLTDDEFNLKLPPNSIIWSGFDSKYLPFSLLEPEIMFNTYSTEDGFTELLYSNAFGYMIMPFSGEVLEVIPSNGQLFVFGSDGICSLAMQREHMAITGRQPFGIKKRGAAGGDEHNIVFIDVFNQLWHISSKGLEKLDYSDYMKNLTGEIYITKDPEEDLFYIGDENYSYVLYNKRLTRVFQTVQNAYGSSSYRPGVAYETGDRKAMILSEKIDLGQEANKTLTGISVGLDNPVKGKAKGLSTVGDTPVESPFVSLNPEGYGAVKIYGKGHQVELLLDSYEKTNVDYLELKWQIDDRRQTRGTYVTQDSSGAG